MRLPSLNQFLSDAARTALRFPFVLLAALVATVCAVSLIEHEQSGTLIRLLMSAQLGIPLLLALALFAERNGRWSLPFGLAGLSLLAVYFFTLPEPVREADWVRFIQFNVAAHLAATFLPWLGRGEENPFWQMGKSLFLRLLNALIFTGVLIAGLNVALLALDKLFGLPVPDETYGKVSLTLIFLFNTWFFLGGVPHDREKLAAGRDYPRGLKVFAQFILAPLVAVYLALLTAYLVKVITTTQWPSGWIGWLVSSVAAAGLISLAMLHPLVKLKENRWISTYARGYFILMLPAVGMQLMAIGKRIGQYGVTENRYFILVLALWLLVVSIFGALNRLKSLRPLPLTLCIVALLSSFGPWGAYSVSRGSQVGRLEALLGEARLLETGTLAPATEPPGHETRREISAVLDYLMIHHGPEAIEPLLAPEQAAEVNALSDSLAYGLQQREVSELVMSYAELEHVAGWRRGAGQRWFNLRRERGGGGVALAGYDRLWPLALPDDCGQVYRFDGGDAKLELDGTDLVFGHEEKSLFVFELDPLLEGLRNHRRRAGSEFAPESLLVLDATGPREARLHVNSITWLDRDEGPRIDRLTGYLLLK